VAPELYDRAAGGDSTWKPPVMPSTITRNSGSEPMLQLTTQKGRRFGLPSTADRPRTPRGRHRCPHLGLPWRVGDLLLRVHLSLH